jgi:WD40 repeat protein
MSRCWPLRIFVLLVLPTASLAGASPQPTTADIDKLIGQLSEEGAGKRRAAARKLEELGEVALEPLKKTLKSAADVDVRLWAGVIIRDIETKLYAQVRQFEAHMGWVNVVAVSADGKLALSGGDDRMVRLWDVESGKVLRTLNAYAPGYAVAFVSGGKQALVGSEHLLRLYNLEDGKEVRYLNGHTAAVYRLTTSGDGKRALAADGGGTVCEWDLEAGRPLRRFNGHGSAVFGLAYVPGEKRLVTAAFDGT